VEGVAPAVLAALLLVLGSPPVPMPLLLPVLREAEAVLAEVRLLVVHRALVLPRADRWAVG